MSNDCRPCSWPYWRDEKGVDEALESYFPDLRKTNLIIAHAYSMIKIAERAIDGEMARLAEEADSR